MVIIANNASVQAGEILRSTYINIFIQEFYLAIWNNTEFMANKFVD